MASITRRDILRLASTAGAVATLPSLTADAAAPDTETLPGAPKANIVYILIDDLRHDCLSIAGHPYVETPNIDRLGREGVHFRNAFCTTSLCSPSRASILSGLYAHAHGVTNNFTEYPAALPNFPRVLQAAGRVIRHLVPESVDDLIIEHSLYLS